ncbi:unnamed protein product [Mesocestoides corti]|uniref:cyclin-dependent kinase n=1 Tax=Mesocestoides corti TaxID=53468 RepID=A0A0R3U973_MESCO|nr:unnamed protein product [Mesocestoides corti]
MQEKYSKGSIIGAGTYGTVYRAREKVTGRQFAIKKIVVDKYSFDNGIPASTMREIGVLIELDQFKHPNIVGVHEIIHEDRSISIVFECVDWDLRTYMDSLKKSGYKPKGLRNGGLPGPLVKSFTRQLLDALRFCHQYKIIHRDIKPSNILLAKNGVIKLADFGLSRSHSICDRTYCHEIVTLWYRAPEIMLGSPSYGTAVDIWSTGCIAYEMVMTMPSCIFLRLPVMYCFLGIAKLINCFKFFESTPTDETWPGVKCMPDYNEEFPKFRPNFFAQREVTKEFQAFIQVGVYVHCIQLHTPEFVHHLPVFYSRKC